MIAVTRRILVYDWALVDLALRSRSDFLDISYKTHFCPPVRN
jgi:hypothetical protein